MPRDYLWRGIHLLTFSCWKRNTVEEAPEAIEVKRTRSEWTHCQPPSCGKTIMPDEWKWKSGPARVLSTENELLITLMKLRLSLNSQFVGHLFGVWSSLVTVILSTWLPLLSLELKPLIFRPTWEQAQNYYPDCFKKYKNVVAIIDCTEVPSLALANGQIYSCYKGRPTAKLLLACTPFRLMCSRRGSGW